MARVGEQGFLMRIAQIFTTLSSVVRQLACRAFDAETLLAKELYRANIEFVIVDPATVAGRNVVGWERAGFVNRNAPIVSVTRNQLSNLDFVNDEMLTSYLAHEDVVVPPGRPTSFTPTDYVNDWCDRFERTGVAVILPRCIEHFVRPNTMGAFQLTGSAQELVIKRKLDTELYNAFDHAEQAGLPMIVYHIRHVDVLPAFLRIFTIRIEPHQD